jgi:conjugative relaxase-like TrwC/TraI family protein
VLRVTTLYASTASATAGYYTKYLTQAEGEEPGRWAGRQAARFGLTGNVDGEQLERLLSGCDPTTGATLGHPLVDQVMADGRVRRAVSGFDATVSAPKSLSAWWALTGDTRLLDAHDVSVNAVIDTIERYGATTRIRSQGAMLHPDSEGLTIAAFRQSTSRLDDPQIHTHVVISNKVQADDGRWFALDARALKKHQRTLGGIYQSVLRAELSERFGVRFGDIVNGQAEVAGVSDELLGVFSKRAAQVDEALIGKEAEFRDREQREPSRFERAAMQREAAADTRRSKTGTTVPDLRSRWLTEADDIGITPASLVAGIEAAARQQEPGQRTRVSDIERLLAERKSTWHRLDVLRTLTDELRPRPGMDGRRWLSFLERATDTVIANGVDLDPAATDGRRRASDGRSIWVEPVAPHHTSGAVLAQEERIATWAIERQANQPSPPATADTVGLDELQAEAAAAVAGHVGLVIVVGPAGSGKTTMLARAVANLNAEGREVFAVAPTAKAARVLGREAGVDADTVAKLIHEWTRADRPPADRYRLLSGETLVVDEAGILDTGDLHTLTRIADTNRWRVVLLGDPQQLHAVGRGGMFDELCANSRVHELTHIHRFTERWEPSASLALRRGDPAAIGNYVLHDRVAAGTIDDHLATIADRWMTATASSQTIAITATTNEHVDLINRGIQRRRLALGDIAPGEPTIGMGGQPIHVGDQIATRRNERQLRTSSGDMIRNREVWTVTAISDAEDVTARRHGSNDTVTLPTSYVVDHVQLGYATTEPGNQGDTHDIALALVTRTTTHRGLYVAMTRGRHENTALVVTAERSIEAAIDILGRVLASDRADTPAISQRRELAAQIPSIVRTPQRHPQCDVPDWWHTLRAATHTALVAVEDDIGKMRTSQVERTDQLQRAHAEVAQTAQALGPHRAEYSAADRRLRRAESAQAEAEAHLDRVGLRGRRAARERLAEARTELLDARTAFEPIDAVWQPLRQAAAKAERSIDLLEDSHEMLDRIDTRRQLPEQHAALRNRIEALDTWRHWATGGALTVEAATAAAEALDVGPDRRSRVLADTMHIYSPELIVSCDAPAFEHDSTRHEIDFDLGR